MRTPASFLLPVLLGVAVQECEAKTVPANVAQRIHYQAGQMRETGFYATDTGPNSTSPPSLHTRLLTAEPSMTILRQPHLLGIIYVSGSGGTLVNIDFKDTAAGYKKGIEDLNAKVHPYVVFGNEGSKAGYATFEPAECGIQPLSSMELVCGDKMFYGIFGDTNGDDGTKAVVGEASISMATLCFGEKINGNSGHDENDVLVIRFAGSKEETVLGAEGAIERLIFRGVCCVQGV
ncbi:glycoside hydrolase family 75 protein [Calycina marina]|uniref:Endo-chitosanase n=1 Tax=Calycina marina TaxID=1763456 RepID=A0A9P7YWP0_9HELO|nr:glycoside hydrolase family 75 protein [Calycina marina]